MSLTAGTAVVIVGAVGLLDASIGRHWDLSLLFGLVAVVGVVGLLAAVGRRRPVTLRSDLATALDDRACRTGEPLEQVLDRAVATYASVLEDPPSRPT